MNRTQRNLLLVLPLALALPACGGGDNNAPAPPALGVQLERMGRPAINTAVTAPFAESTAQGQTRDRYNAAVQSQWASFVPTMAGTLAILDSLDTVCGNQLLAGPTATAGRYNTLATVLADDQLYVNTASGTCNQYLAVEANAVGIANSDCGGRTTLYDVAETSYSVLAAGILRGVDDGIPREDVNNHSLTTFPFLGPPFSR